jgi:hypothetical protein
MQEIALCGGVGLSALVDNEDFEELSGFRWRPQPSKRNGEQFRAVRSGEGGRGVILMHRQIMRAPDGVLVDHANGNPLDNRRSNLRFCTFAQNAQNRRRVVPGSSSRFKGVTWHKQRGRWQAAIKVDKRFIFLGLFTDEQEAADAYDRAAVKHHGEFACTNKELAA